MTRKTWKIAVLSTLVLAGGIVAGTAVTVSGQDAKKRGDTAATATKPITVNRAHVKLIDQVELAAARSGILKFVEPSEGDTVNADQIVAGLNDDVARAEYETAKAQADNDIEVRYAKESYAYATMDLKKTEAANKQTARAFSEIDVEEKKLAAKKTELQIEQAKWQLNVNKKKAEAAKAVLDQFSVVAPFDGVVTDVKKSKGEAVREGDVILEITSTTRVKVEGYLHYSEAWRIKKGMPVTVRLDVDSQTLPPELNRFQGRITFVSLEVNEVAKDVMVVAEVDNPDGVMRAGLEATMTIDLNSGESPKAAAAR